MTRFQTILAQLCAASGETLLHVDSVAGNGMLDAIGVDGLAALGDAITLENVAVLMKDQEVQMVIDGTPAEAEVRGSMALMRIVGILADVQGSSAMLVNGSGKVTTWEQGGVCAAENLDPELRLRALDRRALRAVAGA